MLPYFDQPVWRLGPLSIHAFGVAVAAALWLGLAGATRRFRRVGLDPALGERAGRWTLVGGVLGAHLFSVLLYFPEKLRHDPWLLLRLWEDISSFGGVLGGLAGAWLFFATRADDAARASRLRYLDAVAFVFPAALAVGRVGCALAHDHPGTVTTFPLAISLESDAALAYIRGVYDAAGLALPPTVGGGTGFHDLGLYELLFLGLVVVPLFAVWDRRPRPAGFYLAAFAALYLPVRFYLDTLRVADVRYAGLTPAQWVAVAGMVALLLAVVRRRALRVTITGALVLAGAWACRAGGP
jgi:phosphatidylglycerol:prolipoprotein diacylglycerol transferase